MERCCSPGRARRTRAGSRSWCWRSARAGWTGWWWYRPGRVTVTAVRVLAGLPKPIALVGFDDFELADLLSPPVTVVAQDPPGLGRTAAQLLFRRLDGFTNDKPTRTELPTRLIPRGSGEIP